MSVDRVRLCGGPEVLIACRNTSGQRLSIELLVNDAGHYGTVTALGTFYRKTESALYAHLRMLFGVKRISVIARTRVP